MIQDKKFDAKNNGEEAREAADFVRSVVEAHRTASRPFTVEHKTNDDGSATTVIQSCPDPKKVKAAEAEAKAKAEAEAKAKADQAKAKG